MLTPRELAEFAKVCSEIGDRVADASGFVSVRALLSCFQARLQARPLLVEAMLARDENGDTPWAVLVDSDRHRVSRSEIDGEQPSRTLSARLRNTIAHE